MTFRKRLNLILDPSQRGGWLERLFEVVLITIIILNIAAILLDSVDDIHRRYSLFFVWFELFSVAFFTIEYVARVYSIVENPQYRHPIKGRLRFMATPMSIVDLLAFLPFFLVFLPIDLRVLRIVRLMALFRMFKIARYLNALNVFKQVLRDRREQLVLSLIFILFMLIIISSVMYYIERGEQPEAFSSIPATMWWGVATLTTIGYGDIVPVTPLGKVIGGFFAILGVGLFVLPAGILSSGFYERMHKKSKTVTCPHCGKDFHETA